ncbi:peptidase U32 family protein [Ruminiclostridium cellobioparum]|uniref:Peptidase, U32 family n=1 Tax=Ruminiclostridium cellobioparum subsp. termitidis CT1112 TaxID=1195236 RepID=S0FP98_RUMCE|nr:U32 family peptidase [Ruminiclostridium cellobioparum]EMS72191.1 peptidase, U32 family [Ruminiclostridium cellobioparum subsp. termitidis CT1112]
MKKVELLAPAGNLEKLKMAILYGADAVYIGGQRFGLRASADNFSLEDMREGLDFAHERNCKVYVTVNIIPHNQDLVGLPEYIKQLDELGVDAVIVSDPGIFNIVRSTAPDMEVHISTQANNTNYMSAKFWYDLGAKRIVVARELSFDEIREMAAMTPKDLDIEAFIHGAMCISYSGRCLLSNYMTGRDSNKGACSHPCRWKYQLVEEKRPGEYYPVYEDERGTYIFNSKDLCMIEHIPELIESGIFSLKIEGRMKSSFYVATVVSAYRKAIDAYMSDPENYRYDPEWLAELSKASHREYTTGFYFNKTTGEDQIYNTSSYIRDYDFVGMVLEYDRETGIAKIEQRNRMIVGEEIEVVVPEKDYFVQTIEAMKNDEGESIRTAPHAQMIVYMPVKQEVIPYTILRRK